MCACMWKSEIIHKPTHTHTHTHTLKGKARIFLSSTQTATTPNHKIYLICAVIMILAFLTGVFPGNLRIIKLVIIFPVRAH